MPMLQIKKVKKEYITGDLHQIALDGISLNLRDNEFVAILGPSGSGKTTLLNIIGGLDRYDHGDLIINGISTQKYKDRDWDSYRNHTIGFVFQSYNLIPHQTVLANVELALTISGISKAQRKERAIKALEEVGLGQHIHKLPHQMSGGQMQRVAIARALVNNPDILLADEPTGALDSETSIQVMELLKKVAKDRLVVMVTHNPELAKDYATRIVELKDGHIISDSDPYEVTTDDQDVKHQNMGKASMSFLTSLSLSFNNLKTKKARTLLTAFAGSIGIIGIALILSLSTGVHDYIASIEEETLSEYPLQIQSTGFDFTSMMVDSMPSSKEEKDPTKINIIDMTTNMFSKIGSNDLTSLKDYIENDEHDLKKHTNAIEYTYNVSPQIYNASTKRQVHPDQSFKAIGLGSDTQTNSMQAQFMSTDVFFEMPSKASLYQEQYDIKAGHWPENYNEVVLVLTKNGAMSDFLLYSLGLRDGKDLDKMVDQYAKEEKVEVPLDSHHYTYDDIMKSQLKLVHAYDYYEYDSQYHVYKDKKDDQDYMKKVINNSEDLHIVGVVQPKDSANATMLRSGLYYSADLTQHIINEAKNSDIVKKQIKNPHIDVFSGKDFLQSQKSDFDMKSLFRIDPNMVQKAFTIDQSQLMPQKNIIDFSQIKIDPQTLPPIDMNDLFKDLDVNISKEDMNIFIETISTAFQNYLKDHQLTNPQLMDEYFQQFINSPEGKLVIQNATMTLLESSGLTQDFEKLLQAKIQKIIIDYSQVIGQSIEKQINQQIKSQMGNMTQQFQKAIHFDPKVFSKAIQINMTEKDLSELMLSMMTKETATYENNLKKLGYSDLDHPSMINIYPKDFENKQNVIDILDQYNEQMKQDDPNKVISYTDYVGALMSSVTDIINTISYVLIAFVAISLVVSSIMIGVITYISVLERKKEIGILRAIGASKKNISQVFNAETFIIGLLAGGIGIVTTLLLLIPANALIHNISGNANVNAILPVSGAIILIILSIVLTLLGGLIPSRKASQEDPVKALRSE